ncbi:MAG: hypothetical protein WCF93_04610 [Candidatus Moraniibacteriota bacterium]
MPLEDMNKDLYSFNKEKDSFHPHEKSQYDPTYGGVPVVSPFDEKVQWEKARRQLNPFQKRILRIALAVLFLIILIVGSFVYSTWWQNNAFHQDRVAISFEGPSSADSTQTVKYIIHYKNDNQVTLNNSEIILSYSENFQPINNLNLKFLNSTSSRIFIGNIKPKSEGSVEVTGIFYAPKDAPVYLRGAINFVPSNGKKQLSMETQTSVNITTAPVILDVSAPAQVMDGDRLEYVIDYKNLDLRRLSNVQIRVDFPEGFQMSDSQPTPSQNGSYWTIGDLDSTQGGKIRISGMMHGTDGQSKKITVSLGQLEDNGQLALFNKREMSMQIVLPILTVGQSLDNSVSDVVNAGDVLKYTVTYHNSSTVALRNAIVAVELQGKVLDFSEIKVENGSFDGLKNTITWKASDLPALISINPNDTGKLHFSIPVKSIIPVESSNDKNFVIKTIAQIDSPDIPTPINANKIIGRNTLQLKLASKVILSTLGFFTDVQIKNYGLIPIRVGKETLFAIHWSLVNISNDMVNTRVVSSLPSGTRWTGVTYPSNEKVSYNPQANQLIWDAGNIAAGTGTILPPREVEFQVGVTPQENQVDQAVKLINNSIFTGSDAFTGKDVIVENPEKNTQLREDPTVGYLGGKAVK